MAITSITITQKNITSDCDLLSIHNPLVFIADCAYDSIPPEVVNVKIYDEDDTLLDTFAGIPFNDIAGARQFYFEANSVIKAYMSDYDDFRSNEKVLEYVDGITKIFKVEFVDPANAVTKDSVTFTAMHAVRQFGEYPYLESIYFNYDETIFGAAGKPIYAYVYNDSETNIINVGSGVIDLQRLLDYDDVALLDFDGQFLQSL